MFSTRLNPLFSALVMFSILLGLTQPRILLASELKKESPAEPAHAEEFVPGELIVRYRNSNQGAAMFSTGNKRAQISMRIGRTIEQLDDRVHVGVVHFNERDDVYAVAEQVASDPDVISAEPNYIRHILSEPFALGINDALSTSLYGMTKVDAEKAWAISEATSTATTVVAIIDTGVAYNHPDLASNMWDGTTCLSDTGTALGGCMHGYDFVDNDKDPLPDVDITDLNRGLHGTHIAGVIAAVRNNSIGIAGLAPRAKIMALKTQLESAEIIRAINFARENGAKVINASFGGAGFSSAELAAIQAFPGIVIAAAGNSGSNNDTLPMYPCSYASDNIICVAATDQDDLLPSFSNRGATSVDVGAPGVSITSSIPTNSLFSEPLSSSTVPAIPSSLTSAGADNAWRTATTTVGSSTYTFLYGDTSYPYASNASSSVIIPNLDFTPSTTFDGQLSFGVRCETASTSIPEDYLKVDWSTDGTTFFSTSTNIITANGSVFTFASMQNGVRLDSNVIRTLGGTASGQPGFGTFAYVTIPKSAFGTTTSVRFSWNTNGTDNNYMGCRISNISVTKFAFTNSYIALSGTSMAAPHVAGLAALLSGFRSDVSTSAIKSAILTTGNPVVALSGNTTTGRRVNAYNAIQSINHFKNVLSFGFSETPSATTTINTNARTIQVLVPGATNLASLTPVLTLSQGATSSLSTPLDFSSSSTQGFIVTAGDTSTTSYALTVATSTPATITSISPEINTHASTTFVATATFSDAGAGVARASFTLAGSSTLSCTASSTGVAFVTIGGTGCSLNSSTPAAPLTLTGALTSNALSDGTTTIDYLLVSANGSTTTATRTVIIDNTPPTITLSGASTVNITLNQTWIDPGATAIDALGGVHITWPALSTSNSGTFTIIYTARDTAGNTATTSRTIIIGGVAASSGGSGGGGGGSPAVITGCTDKSAENYNQSATVSNNTCTYKTATSTKAALDTPPKEEQSQRTLLTTVLMNALGTLPAYAHLGESERQVLVTLIVNAIFGTPENANKKACPANTSDTTGLQRFLITKGFLQGSATGYFGPLTRTALTSYQRSNNLPSTGYFGALTLKAILSTCSI